MAAAVADYRPTAVVEGKIKKSGDDGLTVAMEQNPDILREASGRLVKVGFAAETDAVEENARAKVASKGLDLIVANDVSAADSGFGAETNAVTLIGGDGVAQALPLLHKYDVAMHVLDRVATLLAR
jgi:phosphopantothenoylcysteine decarboxylase/phosphopantothenate--cysteine ligase